MSFYTVLPSNSNLHREPTNVGGDYVVHLNETLYLDSSWECGLAEAIYRRDFANVREGENTIIFERLAGYDEALHRKWEHFAAAWDGPLGQTFSNLDLVYQGKKHVIPALGKKPMYFRDVIYHIMTHLRQAINDTDFSISFVGERKISLSMPSEKAAQLAFGKRLIRALQMPPDVQTRLAGKKEQGSSRKRRPAREAPPLPDNEPKKKKTRQGDTSSAKNDDQPAAAAEEEEEEEEPRLDPGQVGQQETEPTTDAKKLAEPSDGDNTAEEDDEKKKSDDTGKIQAVEWNIIPSSIWPERLHRISVRRTFVSIPEGFYSRPDRLVETINKIIPELFPTERRRYVSIGLVANEHNFVRMKITLDGYEESRWWRLGMSESLYEILGFTRDQLVSSDSVHFFQPDGQVQDPQQATSSELVLKRSSLLVESKRPIEISRGVDSLWIYSDIVTPQIVGDRKSPLLRIIPSKGKSYGQTIVIHYDRPQYVSLSRQTISSIAIQIYNTYGLKPIPFNSHVILKLHFRKKKPVV